MSLYSSGYIAFAISFKAFITLGVGLEDEFVSIDNMELPNKEKESNIRKEDDDNVEVNHHSSNKDDEFDVDENTKSVNKEEEDRKDEEPKNNYGELLKFKGAVDDIDDDLII